MKAKEYYAKYHDRLMSADPAISVGGASELMDTMIWELNQLLKSRNAINSRAVCAIVSEVNDKFNAVVRLFESKDAGRDLPIHENDFVRAARQNISFVDRALQANENFRHLACKRAIYAREV